MAWIEYDKGEYCAFKVVTGGVVVYIDGNGDGIPDSHIFYEYAGGGGPYFRFYAQSSGYWPLLNKIFGVCTLPGLVSWVQDRTYYNKLISIEGNPQRRVILEFRR